MNRTWMSINREIRFCVPNLENLMNIRKNLAICSSCCDKAMTFIVVIILWVFCAIVFG